jgi:hypothetical protein
MKRGANMVYQVGKEYFYKGGIVELMDMNIMLGNGNKAALIRKFELKDRQLRFVSPYQDVVIEDIEMLEPLAEHSFKVGDTVVSIIAGLTQDALRATVIGFDRDTNEVLIKSSKLNNYRDKRVRYAYGPKELRFVTAEEIAAADRKIKFDTKPAAGKTYKFSFADATDTIFVSGDVNSTAASTYPGGILIIKAFEQYVTFKSIAEKWLQKQGIARSNYEHVSIEEVQD